MGPKTTVERALGFLHPYQAAQSSLAQSHLIAAVHPSAWLPPDPGQLNLNVDASYSSKGAGYGFVLRDDRGAVKISGAGPLTGVVSAGHAELLALWRAMEHITHPPSGQIFVETDCLKASEANVSSR